MVLNLREAGRQIAEESAIEPSEEQHALDTLSKFARDMVGKNRVEARVPISLINVHETLRTAENMLGAADRIVAMCYERLRMKRANNPRAEELLDQALMLKVVDVVRRLGEMNRNGRQRKQRVR